MIRSLRRWSLQFVLAVTAISIAPNAAWAQSSAAPSEARTATTTSGTAVEAANPHHAMPTDEAVTADFEVRESAARRPARVIVAPIVGFATAGLLSIGAGAVSLFAVCGLRADVHNEGPAGPGCLWSLTAGSAIGGVLGATLGVTVTSMLMRGHGTPTMAFLGSLLGTFAQTAVSAGLIGAGGQEDENFLMIQLGLGLLPAIGATILYEVSSGAWENARRGQREALRMSPSVMMVPGLSAQARTIVPALTLTTF